MRPFDTKAFGPAISWARRHERQISALSLAGGFTFDSFAFGRIDHATTQAAFIVYLLVAGIAIAVLHVLESRPDGKKPSDRTRTILVAITQFALGCLLSGFCVFYIRSASITSSWPFLLAMASIFIGNEYMRRYHARLVFSALLFFFALYSYAILLVPVVAGRMGPRWFLVSGAVAVVVFFFFMRALAWLGHERFRAARMQVFVGMVLITLFLNAAYFLRVLPPLPLVLTDAGVYHDVKRDGADFHRNGRHCSAPTPSCMYSRATSSIFTTPCSRHGACAPASCTTGSGFHPAGVGRASSASRSRSRAGARTAFVSTPPRAHPGRASGRSIS